MFIKKGIGFLFHYFKLFGHQNFLKCGFLFLTKVQLNDNEVPIWHYASKTHVLAGSKQWGCPYFYHHSINNFINI